VAIPATWRSLQGVAGAGVDVEVAAAGRLFHWDVNADADAVVCGVGEGWQARRGGPVEDEQGVGAGGGKVVDRAGLGV